MIKNQTENFFGLVASGYIVLYGKLRKIKLAKEERGRFNWRLLERNSVCPNHDKERHRNVYLDAPYDDERLYGIFESENVYCLSAARGLRLEDKESKYIICLIL